MSGTYRRDVQFPAPAPAPPRARRRLAGVVSPALLVLVTLLLSACADEGASVGTAVVEREDVVEVVEAPGSVTALGSATVSAPASGSVVRLDVAEGDAVQAGQVLFVVDSSSAQQALADAEAADAALADGAVSVPRVRLGEEQQEARRAAEAGFVEARTQAETIADSAARQQALLALDNAEAQYQLSISQADELARQVQAGVSSVASAVQSLSEAQRVQTRAAVEASRAAVEALTVTSPIAGTVSLTASGSAPAAPDIELPPGAEGLLGGLGLGEGGGPQLEGRLRVGAPVSSGQPVLTVTDASELSVVAEVDETDVLLVGAGTRTEVVLDALPGETFETEVGSIDPAPVGATRGGVSFVVRAPLPVAAVDEDGVATGPRPLPGMSAIVRLTVRDVPDVAVVPAGAVVRGEESGDAVWLVADGVATLRPVELGAIGEGVVEVVSGVEAGDEIVVTGVDEVSEGDEIPQQ